MSILEQVLSVLHDHTTNKKFCVAYSGGVDSHALLDILVHVRETNPDISLRAVHVNHGISQFAGQWQTHCEQVCRELNLPLQTYQIKISKKPGESLEAQAREVRYQLLSETLASDEILLTGHNADDQAETMLLQLLRGSGVKGLAAMPAVKAFANSQLLRPLLKVTRAEIEAYAHKMGFVWIEDESNQDVGFDRNYLRHRIMPVLAERWPHVAQSLSRSAENCAQTLELLDEVATTDLKAVDGTDGSLSITQLLVLSSVRQHNLIRYWVQQQRFQLPSKQQLNDIYQMVIAANVDCTPVFRWGQQEIRRYQDKLYVMKHEEFCFATYESSWDLKGEFVLPANLGALATGKTKGNGLDLSKIKGELTVRFRRGGERIMPAGRQETHQLKKLLQEWGVPPWLRDRTPLLFYKDQLVAVVGFCVAKQFATTTSAVGVSWLR